VKVVEPLVVLDCNKNFVLLSVVKALPEAIVDQYPLALSPSVCVPKLVSSVKVSIN